MIGNVSLLLPVFQSYCRKKRVAESTNVIIARAHGGVSFEDRPTLRHGSALWFSLDSKLLSGTVVTFKSYFLTPRMIYLSEYQWSSVKVHWNGEHQTRERSTLIIQVVVSEIFLWDPGVFLRLSNPFSSWYGRWDRAPTTEILGQIKYAEVKCKRAWDYQTSKKTKARAKVNVMTTEQNRTPKYWKVRIDHRASVTAMQGDQVQSESESRGKSFLEVWRQLPALLWAVGGGGRQALFLLF